MSNVNAYDLHITPNPNKKIKTKECRFVTYVPAPHFEMPDMHVVKEVVHYEDGTSEPNLRVIENFERSVYITNKGIRHSHKQHKEWEKLENLIEIKTTEKDLVQNVARALGWRGEFKGDKRKLFESPYIYGADIKSTAVVKKGYMNKYKAETTKFSVCAFDIETDVVRGTGETIMATLSFREKCFSVMVKEACPNIIDVQGKVEKLNMKYLGQHMIERSIKPELLIVDTEIDLYIAIFAKVHEWKPDFLAIWSMDFEINKIIEACDRADYNPAWLFCDPKIPKDYQYFDFIQGKSQKKTANGLITPIKPAARWHTVIAPASFYVIDSMCAFKHTRMGEPERQSYGLDPILIEEFDGKIQKLKFEEAENHMGIRWHQFMQKNYPLDYLVYNRFDCISMELLDDKVMDLAVLLQQFSGTSDFADFKSQPRRQADALHWFVLERGYVMGVTSKALVDEFDEDTLDRKDWIITLPAELIVDGGLRILEEGNFHRTAIFAHVGDLDVSASYPNGEVCYNISKETTSREIESIEGVDEEVFRQQNMGLTAGHVNAVDYCVNMMGFPRLEDLLTMFRNQKNKDGLISPDRMGPMQ